MKTNATTRRQWISQAAGAIAASIVVPHVYAAEPRRKTILLKSAWDTVNIGDIGHTPGTLRVFEQHLPDCDVILWPSKINDKVEAMLRRRFPKLAIARGGTGKDFLPTGKELIAAFDRADLIVHNSSMAEPASIMQTARKLGKPYGLFGQSNFSSFVEKKENAELLNHAAFAFCRETLTLALYRQAGVRGPVLDFNPDGCFGIDVRDDVAAAAFMKERGLERRKFITIQLRTNTQKHPGTDSFLNPANPTPAQQADDERRAEIFRKIVTAWVTETGLKVLIAPEVEKEIKHNQRLILDRLPPEIAKHVVLRDLFWNADEAASVFAQAHTVVCHEPHSCIIALANGTPILHTYSPFHSPKWHMFADIGLREWLPPLDEEPPADIIRRLLKIHADYDGALAKVRQSMQFVAGKFAASAAVLRKTLA